MAVAHKCDCNNVTEEDVFTLENSYLSRRGDPNPKALLHRALWIFPDLFQHSSKLPIPLVKHVSRQLLEALDSHSQCCVIRTGKMFQRFGSSF